jgi:redox-sensitive bicupin YhaK (pirin superfamily)
MSPSRHIVARTRGHQHGFIRRLVSPGDFGQLLKPFIFLDHVRGRVRAGQGFGWHPHSGIATLTYARNADVDYEDTTGQKGLVRATGLEWMRAGKGTWHRGAVHPHGEEVEAFQLWVALPPSLEEGPAEGIYVTPEDVPQRARERVLLGTYEGASHPIPAPSPLVYLDLDLPPGEVWRYAPPPGHTVAWALVYQGTAQVGGEAISDELVVLDPSDAPIEIHAPHGARVLFGCAQPHPYPLVLGTYSVHTHPDALRRGEAHIVDVHATLRRDGRL